MYTPVIFSEILFFFANICHYFFFAKNDMGRFSQQMWRNWKDVKNENKSNSSLSINKPKFTVLQKSININKMNYPSKKSSYVKCCNERKMSSILLLRFVS